MIRGWSMTGSVPLQLRLKLKTGLRVHVADDDNCPGLNLVSINLSEYCYSWHTQPCVRLWRRPLQDLLRLSSRQRGYQLFRYMKITSSNDCSFARKAACINILSRINSRCRRRHGEFVDKFQVMRNLSTAIVMSGHYCYLYTQKPSSYSWTQTA